MKVAASGTDRRHDWITAYRRPSFRRAIIRRLPSGVGRWVLAVNRWRRRAVAQLRNRWHRSLQFRVVTTTLVLSAFVIAALGFFLVQFIAEGLLSSAEKSASNQVTNGYIAARGLTTVNVLAPPSGSDDAASAVNVASTTTRFLQSATANTGSYLVFIHVINNKNQPDVQWVGPLSVEVPATIPSALVTQVGQEQGLGNQSTQPPVYYQPTTLVYSDPALGTSGPALAAGVPLGQYYQLYYVFPLTQQQQTLALVQRVLIGIGLALVLLLAAIASLVTRWVVVPVRQAAEAAQRLSAGRLEERLPVLGKDDLAALATSFNEMAASLQDKLRELEELSKVQRVFVSDVSHELRTPLATIKMAVEILFESRGELEPARARSVELLQSQLDRFETLLVDLLEISRFDAGAATLDAELVDVCDLVRRSADDAQQLATHRGSRIEFRLPAAGCFAEVDRRRVERILRNLLVNAVEHGEGKDVVVTAAIDSDAVAVSVRDFGVGLGPGEEQLVFERFWRADPSRDRSTGGTGLGLAISQEDARLHGGWLQAWGEFGKGSVFRLTLPRVAGQAVAGSPLPLGPDDTEIVTGLTAAAAYPEAQITGVVSRG
jgi:two-component system sensor histidine kinase MtrB